MEPPVDVCLVTSGLKGCTATPPHTPSSHPDPKPDQSRIRFARSRHDSDSTRQPPGNCRGPVCGGRCSRAHPGKGAAVG
jgi:hypothetical protein